MKRILGVGLVLLLASAVAIWAAGSFYPVSMTVVTKTTSVTTNAATTDLLGGLVGSSTTFVQFNNGVSNLVVSLTSGGSTLVTLTNSQVIVFPSSTYPFIPRYLYGKIGDAGCTNSCVATIGKQ